MTHCHPSLWLLPYFEFAWHWTVIRFVRLFKYTAQTVTCPVGSVMVSTAALLCACACWGFASSLPSASDMHSAGATAFDGTLTVHPAVVQASGDVVTVSWSNVATAAAGDWLALFSADNSTYFAWTYAFPALAERALASNNTAAAPTSGNMTFVVYNMRLPLQFRYYAATSTNHVYPPLLVSHMVTFAALDDEPTQVHISLTERAGFIRVCSLG